MAFTVDVAITRRLTVQCDYDTCFDTLADVPYSASFFPKVKNLVDLGDETYRWEMEKIGLDVYHIQTIYACEYYWDRDEGWIEWSPVDDVGNARVEGRWELNKVDDNKTKLKLTVKGALELPLPKLSKMMLAPMVKSQFEDMVEEYVENLQEHWEEDE